MRTSPREFGPVAGRVFRELARVSRERKQHFVLVYLPYLVHLPEEPTPEARWVETFARREKILLINLTGEFEALAPRELHRLFGDGDPHYSPAGNEFVARALLRRLRELIPDFPR